MLLTDSFIIAIAEALLSRHYSYSNNDKIFLSRPLFDTLYPSTGVQQLYNILVRDL